MTKNLKRYWYFASENKIYLVNNLNSEGKKKSVRSIFTRRIGTVVKPKVNKGFELGVVHLNFRRMINNMEVKPLIAKKIVWLLNEMICCDFYYWFDFLLHDWMNKWMNMNDWNNKKAQSKNIETSHKVVLGFGKVVGLEDLWHVLIHSVRTTNVNLTQLLSQAVLDLGIKPTLLVLKLPKNFSHPLPISLYLHHHLKPNLLTSAQVVQLVHCCWNQILTTFHRQV